jgi:hypothetical protein
MMEIKINIYKEIVGGNGDSFMHIDYYLDLLVYG